MNDGAAMNLPGYDAWKLATPPDTDEAAGWRECADCGQKFWPRYDEAICGACFEPEDDDGSEEEEGNRIHGSDR
jgi:hypothetical protein